MIKLITLLKEIETEQSIIAKLSPEDKQKYEQALAILQDETLEESVMDKLKKLGLSAAVITALSITPQLSKAEKAPLDQLTGKSTTTQTVSTVKTNPNFWVKDTNDIKKVQSLFKIYRMWTLERWKNNLAHIIDTTKFYKDLTPEERGNIEASYMSKAKKTDIDGLNGQYTSTFVFPDAFLRDLDAGTTTNLGMKGNEALKASLKAAKGTLDVEQLKEWNDFVKWMKSIKASGNSKMDNKEFSDKILQQYKELNK
jgi:hypothetical protein